MVRVNAHPFRRPSRRLAIVVAGCALGATLVSGPLPAANAEVLCTDDGCDEGLWKNARGVSDENSYWGMTPGHNCTNYVAWKLIGLGVPRPATGPGNAGEWAANAIADGYLVNRTPAVGAVAQWDAGTPMGGELGHVAYVEAVHDDGSIVISEDFWRAEFPGPLTFRLVPAESVSNFIHYFDTTDWLRTLTPTGTGWAMTTSGLDVSPTMMTSVTAYGVPTVVMALDGRLVTASEQDGRWSTTDTGLTGEIAQLSAASTSRGGPFVMTVERGSLVMNAGLRGGWQRMPTGVRTEGEIAAVDLGGIWPTVYISEAGGLYRVWGDPEGWHVEPTGLESWGSITAVVNAAGWPEVYGVHDGMIQRSWQDDTGWHQTGTGIAVAEGTSLDATVSGGLTNLVVVVDDRVQRYIAEGEGWRLEDTAADAGALVTAVDVGGSAPMIVQVG